VLEEEAEAVMVELIKMEFQVLLITAFPDLVAVVELLA
jgi:hypothetical protein